MRSDVCCGPGFGDCALVRSGGEGNGVSGWCDASGCKELSSVTTLGGAGGVGIVRFGVSLVGVSLVFTCGTWVVEVLSGEEIEWSGGMVVNESIGGTIRAGSLMSGCSGTLG